MSAAEHVSEASTVEQENECAVQAKERTDEQLAQYLQLHPYSWPFCPTVECGMVREIERQKKLIDETNSIKEKFKYGEYGGIPKFA